MLGSFPGQVISSRLEIDLGARKQGLPDKIRVSAGLRELEAALGFRPPLRLRLARVMGRVRLPLYVGWIGLLSILPAVGYDDAQLEALQETLRRADCDVIVSASPIDLGARVSVGKPILRARYEYADDGEPRLGTLLDAFVERRVRQAARC